MDHSAMKREDTRRENARALAAAAGGLAEFGRKTGMENSQVSQLIGKTPTKNIGNLIAKRIETAFNLQAGALDSEGLAPERKEIGAAPKSATEEARTPAEFQRHWLNKDEADHLAEYRSLTDSGRKTLRIITGRMQRVDVNIDAVDES